MNISRIEKASQKYVFLAAVIGLTLFAGAKHGSPTNDPPDSTGGDASPTNDPPAAAPLVQVQSPSPRMELLPLLSSTSPSHFDSITNWTARGAYCDWKRIEFGDSFSFPFGTNLLTGVTLMSYGELRPSLLPNPYSLIPPLSALPKAVSLEPAMSSVSYGLTPSNSFVFIWENACVNREATNRINAAIELFPNGAIAITTQFGNQPPTTNYQLPTNPPGFIGEGQNLDWVTNAFPAAASNIAEKGYETWLMEDYVGINEPNGRYKVSVTVHSLPEHGPCYLVVGPYRMVVTQPGTYSFPLEVFNEYLAYTCPTRMPLSMTYDDGYRGETDATPPLMMSALPPMTTVGTPDYYIICMTPHVYAVPSHIPLDQAVGTRIGLWCNCSGGTWDYYSYFSNHLRLTFGFPSYAEIRTAEVADQVIILMRVAGHECTGVFYIDPPYHDPTHDPNPTNGVDNTSGTNTNTNATNENTTAQTLVRFNGKSFRESSRLRSCQASLSRLDLSRVRIAHPAETAKDNDTRHHQPDTPEGSHDQLADKPSDDPESHSHIYGDQQMTFQDALPRLASFPMPTSSSSNLCNANLHHQRNQQHRARYSCLRYPDWPARTF